MIIPVRSHKQDLGLKTSMILQDFVCKITTDFGTISGELMPDKSCMMFCDGLCKILQDLTRTVIALSIHKSETSCNDLKRRDFKIWFTRLLQILELYQARSCLINFVHGEL